jgi:hypothetical protein
MLAERLTHPLLPAVRSKPEPSLPMTADQYHYQQQALRTYQRRFDDALCRIGWRAPAPVLGQSELDYQREVLRAIKQTFLQNHELYKVQMRQLNADAVEAFTQKVIDAALSEYNNPDERAGRRDRAVGPFRRMGQAAMHRLDRARVLHQAVGTGVPQRLHSQSRSRSGVVRKPVSLMAEEPELPSIAVPEPNVQVHVIGSSFPAIERRIDMRSSIDPKEQERHAMRRRVRAESDFWEVYLNWWPK